MRTIQDLIKSGEKVNSEHPDVVELAQVLDESPKLLAAYINQTIYRNAYNQKPDVKAARQAYNRRRSSELTMLRKLVRQNPELLASVVGKD